jgi:glycosyltransferase involved in cell wall biosynthesis
VVAPCFNERGNITELYERVRAIFEKHPQYEFTLLLIDNYSSDGTRQEIEDLCSRDRRVQAIFNSRNFGHIRSPYHALMEAKGDAVITTVSDLQVDPEIIDDYLRKREEGFDVVIGVKQKGEDSILMSVFRNAFYAIINKLSDIPLKKNFIGLGLYDRKVIESLRKFHDPYPYFRGLVFEVGFKRAEIDYVYKGRKRGVSANNFLILYDLAMLGIVSHSKIPLRLATMAGFVSSILSFLLGCYYLVY